MRGRNPADTSDRGVDNWIRYEELLQLSFHNYWPSSGARAERRRQERAPKSLAPLIDYSSQPRSSDARAMFQPADEPLYEAQPHEEEPEGIAVHVRVRPLNEYERSRGDHECVYCDPATQTVRFVTQPATGRGGGGGGVVKALRFDSAVSGSSQVDVFRTVRTQALLQHPNPNPSPSPNPIPNQALRALLAQRYPDLQPLLPRCALARNAEYVQASAHSSSSPSSSPSPSPSRNPSNPTLTSTRRASCCEMATRSQSSRPSVAAEMKR